MSLSIIIPSIRPDNWGKLINDIILSVKNYYDTEIIFVGPYTPTTQFEKNIRIITDWSSPSRCLQIGALFANKEYLCWLPDDIKIEQNALEEAMLLLKSKNKKDGIILRYSEGEGFTGIQDRWLEYWRAVTHDGLRFKQVKPEWMMNPVFMYHTSTFKEFGGLDTRFEHINLNTADLAFRIQIDGGKLYLSPTKVFSADWNPNQYTEKHKPVQLAYDENDLPLFKSIWDADILTRDTHIQFDNWQKADTIWKRRFNSI